MFLFTKVCIVFLAILKMDEEDFEDISDENEAEVETGLRYSVCICSLPFCIILYCSIKMIVFILMTNYLLFVGFHLHH